MTQILTGWYENDTGAVMIDREGKSLSEIVAKLQREDADFGHTDMELELHLPDGEVKCVEDVVYRMVEQ